MYSIKWKNVQQVGYSGCFRCLIASCFCFVSFSFVQWLVVQLAAQIKTNVVFGVIYNSSLSLWILESSNVIAVLSVWLILNDYLLCRFTLPVGGTLFC